MVKKVSPDKDGAADKQCLEKGKLISHQDRLTSVSFGQQLVYERKTPIPNQGKWILLSFFRQIHLGEGLLQSQIRMVQSSSCIITLLEAQCTLDC